MQRGRYLGAVFARKLMSNPSRMTRLQSTATKAPPATGTAIIDPLIGLTNDQGEFYQLARAFADEQLRPFAGKMYTVFLLLMPSRQHTSCTLHATL